MRSKSLLQQLLEVRLKLEELRRKELTPSDGALLEKAITELDEICGAVENGKPDYDGISKLITALGKTAKIISDIFG